jgi:beta-glucosidase
MARMTVDEKIGQLNLPTSGDIGQPYSSDVAKILKRGKVGGLFNIKSVEKIKITKDTVEKPINPLLFFWDGRDSWLRNYFSHSLGLFFYLGYEID